MSGPSATSNPSSSGDVDFDAALVAAAFRIAGESGWRNVNVAAAARAAGLPVAEARGRFPTRSSVVLRFGRLVDQAALKDAPSEGPVRDRLFDLLMRRFDALQAHREGVLALMRALPAELPTAMLLTGATRNSMRWMLQASGITATRLRGELQVNGLFAVWLWGLRAWEKDETDDLSGTMAAIDTALNRAEQMTSWLRGRQMPESPPPPPISSGAGELDPSDTPSASVTDLPDVTAGAGELDPSNTPPASSVTGVPDTSSPDPGTPSPGAMGPSDPSSGTPGSGALGSGALGSGTPVSGTPVSGTPVSGASGSGPSGPGAPSPAPRPGGPPSGTSFPDIPPG